MQKLACQCLKNVEKVILRTNRLDQHPAKREDIVFLIGTWHGCIGHDTFTITVFCHHPRTPNPSKGNRGTVPPGGGGS